VCSHLLVHGSEPLLGLVLERHAGGASAIHRLTGTAGTALWAQSRAQRRPTVRSRSAVFSEAQHAGEGT